MGLCVGCHGDPQYGETRRSDVERLGSVVDQVPTVPALSIGAGYTVAVGVSVPSFSPAAARLEVELGRGFGRRACC